MPIGASKLNLFSQNKEFYVTVAHATSPRITVYNQDGDSLTKISDPGTLPTGDGWACTWSPDGVYLAVGHATSPYLTIYKRSGNTLTKLDNPASLPTDTVFGISFSRDGVYLAVVNNATTDGLRVYKRSGDTFTSIYNTNLSGNGRAASFDNTATYLLVTHRGTTDKISVYKRTNDSFSKLTNPPSYPATQVTWGNFSNDGVYLAVSSDGTPYANVWKRTGDSFTKLTSPTVNSVIVRSMIFDPSGYYLVITQQTTPFITIHKRQGDRFYEITRPTQSNGDPIGQPSWSSDGRYFIIGQANSPYFSFYRRDGDALTKLTNPATGPTGAGRSASFVPRGFDSTLALVQRPYQARCFGDARIRTANFKFGTSSLYCDGTTDAIRFVGESIYFGTGAFTIEFWYRADSIANTKTLFDQRITTGSEVAPSLQVATTGQLNYVVNGANRISSSTGAITTSTWYHIALARSGTTTKLFIDGLQVGSDYTDTNDYLNQPLCVGSNIQANGTVGTGLAGYIDELRVSKIARYTANFTAPTGIFTNDTDTVLLCHFEGSDASTVITDDQG